jgi:tripartite-type tricarboxylate transporter receptor subunit TctC
MLRAMTRHFRRILHGLVAAATMGCAMAAAADDFQNRPITIIVPYQAGGTNDVIARPVAAKLSQMFGQPVLVETKPGANGNVGADFVAKSKPDGSTILITPAGPLSINPWIYRNMPFDPEKDLAPLTLAATVPNLLVVPPSLPANSIAALIALAKAKPGELNFGSQGVGSTGHLNGELFKTTAHIDMTHVPYKGSAPAMNDLLAGQVEMMFDNFPTAITQVRGGKLRALAVTSAARHWSAPDIPAISETVAGYDAVGWFGFLVAGGTPRPIVERLATALADALKAPEVAPRLREVGLDIVASTPEAFAAFIHGESVKWRRVVELSGAKAD